MSKRTVMILAVVFLISGSLFGIWKFRPDASEDFQAIAVSKLFATTMPDSNGRMQALGQWKGKALIINFWATWCAPCIQEMPELSEFQSEISNKNIQLLGIGIDSEENIAEFLSQNKIAYPLYRGGMDATELSRKLGNQAGGLPYTVLIASNGQVKRTYLGRLKLDQLRADLELLTQDN